MSASVARYAALLTAALAFPLPLLGSAGVSAQALPRPSPLMQKELDGKGIGYNDWLLFHGIRAGNVGYVSAALKAGAQLDKARNPIGDLPPLMVAVSVPVAGPEMVSLLVKHGADVNRRWVPQSGAGQSTGSFPLYQAARFSNAETVEALIKHGADAKARASNGGTPLHNTFDVGIGQVLVRHGVEVNARNKTGQTPLAVTRRALAQLDREPYPELRPKIAAFQAWLRSQGAVE
jgi:hypothetical protein